MSETGTRDRSKTEVTYRVHLTSPLDRGGYYMATFPGDPTVPEGISCISAERATADLYQNAAYLDARAAEASQPQDPVQDLMRATADLTAAITRHGWQHKTSPAITPDGEVQLTLRRRGQEPETHPS